MGFQELHGLRFQDSDAWWMQWCLTSSLEVQLSSSVKQVDTLQDGGPQHYPLVI